MCVFLCVYMHMTVGSLKDRDYICTYVTYGIYLTVAILLLCPHNKLTPSNQTEHGIFEDLSILHSDETTIKF